MDFGDDPLGDVLSDGSNDSFFDEPRPIAKSSTKTPEKKSVTDLFNIGDRTDPAPKKSDDWLGLDSAASKSPLRAQKVTKKISFDDDEDVLGGSGFTKRAHAKSEKPFGEENKSSKKADFLESILGSSSKAEEVKKPSFDDILKESKAKSLTSTPTTPKASLASESLQFGDVPREGRRRRRSSTGLLDPLGLFSNETKPEDAAPAKETPLPKATYSKSAPNVSDQGLPDWLGRPPVTPSKSESLLHHPPGEPTKSGKMTPPPEVQKTKDLPSDNTENIALSSFLTQQKLTQSHMEYQNTAIALQQQESQVLMALQLKKYEENLSEMQMKQQELLMKQEQQFNMLLERQFAKQQIMENNMRLQQERINNHIQMLLAQPPVGKFSKQEETEEMEKNADDENVKLYENIIASLKQRQQEQVLLLEESYKKQIQLLEQSLESVEKRLKADVERITEDFEEKLNTLQQHHNDEITKYKQKIQEMDGQHCEQLKQIKENHHRIVEEIKFEHATLLENIRDSKKSEASLLQESNTYLQKLDSNIEILYSNSKSLVEMKDRMDKDYGILSKAREESLRAKEQEIIMMKQTLEKCREEAEKDRAELLALVRTLETKIAEQNQNAREERWAFQQAAGTLAARSAAMDRESEFNRAAIEREREQLKTLKEQMLAEQERMMLQMTEEKLSLSAEKSRVETSTKLMISYDAQKAKSEIDAAVQVAKEAAEMADREREILHRERCEIEKLKRTLQDQERKLSLRENEAENTMRDAEYLKNEGEKAISESKAIENKYNERLRDLQNQLTSLANREKKLAEEKILLSKERVALNALMRQRKKCSLCNDDPQRPDDGSFTAHLNNMVTPYFSSFENVNSDIIRLRLEAADEFPMNIEEHVPR